MAVPESAGCRLLDGCRGEPRPRRSFGKGAVLAAPCPEMLPRTAAVWPKPSGLLSKYILWLYSKFYTQCCFGWANHVRIDGSWYRVRSPRIGLYSERRIATVDPVLKSRERAVMTSPPGPR
jgi:hypothetical protein